MPADPTITLLDRLRQCELLEPSQLQEIGAIPEANDPDPRALGRVLLRREWLTRFQIQEVARGRGKELVIGPYILLDKLRELKLFDEVLIVFTTDHGTMLAEHDVWMKNFMPLYNEIVRIPLIVKLPKNAHAGSRRDGLTQTIDLMPTFPDAAMV